MNFVRTAELLNKLFTKQCFLVNSNSNLASVFIKTRENFVQLSSFSKVISQKCMNEPNKFDGFDMIMMGILLWKIGNEFVFKTQKNF